MIVRAVRRLVRAVRRRGMFPLLVPCLLAALAPALPDAQDAPPRELFSPPADPPPEVGPLPGSGEPVLRSRLAGMDYALLADVLDAALAGKPAEVVLNFFGDVRLRYAFDGGEVGTLTDGGSGVAVHGCLAAAPGGRSAGFAAILAAEESVAVRAVVRDGDGRWRGFLAQGPAQGPLLLGESPAAAVTAAPGAWCLDPSPP